MAYFIKTSRFAFLRPVISYESKWRNCVVTVSINKGVVDNICLL